MPFVRKCAKCGLDLTDPSEMKCPVCGSSLAPSLGGKIWVVALFQIVMATTFMLIFRFPKPMIGVGIVFILIATGLSSYFKTNPRATRPVPQSSISQPVLFKLLSIGMALSAFALFATLLFSFVIFMNAWNTWHQYAGLAHHETDFIVTRAYYQVRSRGAIDVYASGTVEGQREWMSLMPYLHTRPHDEDELDERVPVGTSIHVYFYPALKGRLRVVVFNGIPPDETNHRLAMRTLNYGLIGIAVATGLIFLLSRLRRACYADDATASLSATASR